MLLTTAKGQCIRFAVADVRVFKGRDSMGVRGITLGEGDSVISLSILRHIEATAGRAQRLSQDAPRRRRGDVADRGGRRRGAEGGGERPARRALSQERYAEMSAAEQVILTISENGFGKRTSSYEYRITGPRRQRHRRDGGQRSATASSSPPSRSSTATRSCW